MCMLRQGCSLSMVHRTCENCQGVRLGRLSMPNIMGMPFYFKSRGIKKNPTHIWCKWNLSTFLFNVELLPLMYTDSFNSSDYAMVLPPYYLEIILSGSVTCIVTMVVYRGGFLQVIFESFSKGPRSLSYIFLITCKVPTLEPVDGSTFVFHGVFVLGGN